MTPVQYTEEEAYNAADLSLGLSQKNKTRACLKWHCAFVMWISDGDREVWSSTELQCKINSVSHWKHDMAYLSVTAHKKTHHALFHFTAIRLSNRRCSTCASDQIIKVKAYVNFCKKIIYPSTSLYKVCSKRKKKEEYSSLGTELLLSPRKERGELSPAPLWLQHHPVKSSFWFKWMEPRSGPRSLDTTQHAITSQSSTEHMFLWETRGGFRNFWMKGPDWGMIL